MARNQRLLLQLHLLLLLLLTVARPATICRLRMLGGAGGVDASLACTGGRIAVVLHPSLAGRAKLSGVRLLPAAPIASEALLTVEGNTSATFVDSVISGLAGSASLAALVAFQGNARVELRDSTVSNNTMRGPLGALYVGGSARLLVHNTSITGNTLAGAAAPSATGAGLAIAATAADGTSPFVRLHRCVVAHNRIAGEAMIAGGAGISIAGGVLELQESQLHHNVHTSHRTDGAHACAGGAVQASAPPAGGSTLVRVTRSVFTSNTMACADACGGGALSVTNVAGSTPSSAVVRVELLESVFDRNTVAGAMAGGGAVHVLGSVTVLARRSVFASNAAEGVEDRGVMVGGGALALSTLAHATLEDCRLLHNRAGKARLVGGGAIVVSGPSTLDIARCELSNNSVTSGPQAQMPLFGSSANIVADAQSTVGTSSLVGGGAISLSDASNATLALSRLAGNSVIGAGVAGGGAVSLSGASVLQLLSCTLENNSVAVDMRVLNPQSGSVPIAGGGAVSATTGTAEVRISRSVLSHNRVQMQSSGTGIAGDAGGAAVAVAEQCRVSIALSNVHHNNVTASSGAAGGGLLASGSATLRVDNSTIAHNLVVGLGGARGGAVALADDASARVLNNCFLFSNRVLAGAGGGGGGGIDLAGHSSANVSSSELERNSAGDEGTGGAVRAEGRTTVVLEHCRVARNEAVSGGGLAGTDSSWTITASRIANHSTVGPGGGIWLSGATDAVLRASTITDNRASDGAGIYLAQRSAGRGRASVLAISHSNISHNEAMMAGAGLFLKGGRVRLGPGTRVLDNRALQQAGGLGWFASCLHAACASTLDVSCEAVIANNTALVAGGGAFIGASAGTLNLTSPTCLERAASNNSAAFGNANVFIVSRSCELGEIVRGSSGWCEPCPPNMWSDTNASSACMTCPPHANCTGGAVLLPLPGWWHSHPLSKQLHPCPNPAACDQARAGGAAPSIDAQLHVPGALDWQCAEGSRGVLCMSCDLGFGASAGLRCSRCMPRTPTLLLYGFSLLCMLLLLACMAEATWRDNQQTAAAVRASDALKVIVLHLQYLVLIATTPIAWPRSLAALLSAVNHLLASCTGEALALDCMLGAGSSALPLGVRRQTWHLLVPFGMAVAVLLVHLAARCVCAACAACRAGRRGTGSAAARRVRPKLLLPGSKVLVLLLVVLYTYFPSLVRVALTAFACMRVDAPAAHAAAAAPRGMWLADMQVECHAGAHTRWALAIGLPCVLVFCVGVPVGVALLLYLNRSRLGEAQFRQRWGLLTRNWRHWWGECAVGLLSLQTVCLVLISVYSAILSAYYELVLLVAAFGTSLAVQVAARPAAFPRLHGMQTFTVAALLCTAFAGLTFVDVASLEERSTPAAYKEAAGALLLALNVACLCNSASTILTSCGAARCFGACAGRCRALAGRCCAWVARLRKVRAPSAQHGPAAGASRHAGK